MSAEQIFYKLLIWSLTPMPRLFVIWACVIGTINRTRFTFWKMHLIMNMFMNSINIPFVSDSPATSATKKSFNILLPSLSSLPSSCCSSCGCCIFIFWKWGKKVMDSELEWPILISMPSSSYAPSLVPSTFSFFTFSLNDPSGYITWYGTSIVYSSRASAPYISEVIRVLFPQPVLPIAIMRSSTLSICFSPLIAILRNFVRFFSVNF